jgi:hypothetical protein
VIDSPVDVYVFRASFSAFFCKTLQRYTTKLLKPVSGAEKNHFSAFFYLIAVIRYCQEASLMRHGISIQYFLHRYCTTLGGRILVLGVTPLANK